MSRPLIGVATVALLTAMAMTASCSSESVNTPAAPGSSQAGTTIATDTTDSSGPPSTVPNNGTNSDVQRTKNCTTVDERSDGRYTAGEAGTVIVQRDGSNLKLVDVEAESGWTVKVDKDDDPDEVEVDLRSTVGTKIQFEAEIEDSGRLEIEVCVIS